MHSNGVYNTLFCAEGEHLQHQGAQGAVQYAVPCCSAAAGLAYKHCLFRSSSGATPLYRVANALYLISKQTSRCYT